MLQIGIPRAVTDAIGYFPDSQSPATGLKA
jgi:hypothetical protein